MTKPKRLPLTGTLLAARWAQQLGLPPGNLWEPALARHVDAEIARLGGDASAAALTTVLFEHRLGLPREDV